MSDIQFNPPKVIVTSLAILLVVFSAFGLVKTVNEVKRSGFIGQEFDRVNTISVQGEGTVESQPDIAMIDLSVVTNGLNVARVQADNTKNMNSILAFLDEQGVEDRDIQTQNYNIIPQYDFTENGRQFRGYRITQTVNVKIRDFDTISTIFDESVNRGANQVSGLRFDIDEKEELQADARGEAIEDAQEKADVLADQLGVNLVRIISFNENTGDFFPQPQFARSEFALDESGFGGGPTIAPGETEIKSTVNIIYEIN